ncbi:hypothetical protein ACH4TC_40520 [Streptomyces spororaveus]|uniref:hypothetical protein n=1 Tax=Streptomyces spororaveus TaxID=284039 RepID=UPI003798D8C1
MAPGWSADQLRGHLCDDVLTMLMQGADRPRMVCRLPGLQQAGVDLGVFLSQMGRMTAGVHQAVTANAARIKAEGSDRWAGLLRTTMPEALVRDAILASPAWPDIAAAMGHLDAKGIDVARIFTDAHRAGVGVDQAGAAVTASAANTPAPASTAVAAPAPAPASTAPAAIAVAAPGTAAGAAAPGRDVLAERMGAVGDLWAAPARRVPGSGRRPPWIYPPCGTSPETGTPRRLDRASFAVTPPLRPPTSPESGRAARSGACPTKIR